MVNPDGHELTFTESERGNPNVDPFMVLPGCTCGVTDGRWVRDIGNRPIDAGAKFWKIHMRHVSNDSRTTGIPTNDMNGGTQ